MAKIEKVLSFDQAANLTGWSYWEGEKPVEWGVITPIPKNAKDGQRLNSLYDQFTALIDKYHPNIVIYEPPIGSDDDGKGHKTLYVLSQIAGLLEMIVAKHIGMRLVEMPAATWQYNCGIHKRDRLSRKSGAREFVEREYKIPQDKISQDEVDSLCIAYSFFVQRARDREECAF